MFSRRPRVRSLAATPVLAIALALAVAACGGSSTTTSATTTSGGSTTSSASTGSATTEVPSTTDGVQAPAAGPVPAVTGATDLTKEPTIAAGGANPPSVLTGADLVTGTGTTAAAADTVEVQYVGALYTTGQVFDASWTDSGPTSFPLSGVVPGFRDALIGMKVGGRREVVIPPALGYGAAGQPPTIPGNATLVFVIDLLGVTP